MVRPAYLPAMPVKVWSPFLKRWVWLSEREAALVAKVTPSWKGTQRLLALLSGYSLRGLSNILATLRKLGILGISTKRGRLGFTRLALQAGVRRLLNVAYVDVLTSVDRDSVSTLGDISFEEGQSRPAGTSRFLKIDPWQPAT
ncbi:MAG: hypothetical protein ACOYBU_14085 [Dermatophilaceae bacterium]|jgi:hypothetical protein